jgi:hypothetical protein
MKLLLALSTISTLLLSACTAVPISAKFPDAPPSLQDSCPELQQTNDTDKLSDVMAVVVANYGLYHECQLKVEAWQDWHKKQKDIFDKLK